MQPEDILVLTSAYTPNEAQWYPFYRSCMDRHVPVHVLGLDEELPPGLDPIKRGVEFLEKRTEEYIIITDSFDVLCNRWNPDEVRMQIDSAPNLIMSVEPLVWPEGCPDTYPPADRYKWRAINGGQYAGRREQIIEMWRVMWERWVAGEAHRGGSSQEILHYLYDVRDDWPFTLDLECRLFQSMIGPNAQYIVPRGGGWSKKGFSQGNGIAFNSVTGSCPMFLHFNGKALGIDEWTKILI